MTSFMSVNLKVVGEREPASSAKLCTCALLPIFPCWLYPIRNTLLFLPFACLIPHPCGSFSEDVFKTFSFGRSSWLPTQG